MRFFLWILPIGFGMILVTPLSAGTLYDPHGKRDPFVPLVSASSRAWGLMGVETLDEIVVEGVVYDAKGGSIVIVNGTILKEGEEHGPLRVIQIRPDGAVFSVNGMEGFKPLYKDQGK